MFLIGEGELHQVGMHLMALHDAKAYCLGEAMMVIVQVGWYVLLDSASRTDEVRNCWQERVLKI